MGLVESVETADRETFVKIIYRSAKAQGVVIQSKVIREFLNEVERICPWTKQRPPVSISSWKVVGEQLTSYDSENPGDLELTSFFMYNIVKAALQDADGCCDWQPRQFPASTQTTPAVSPDSSPEPSRASSPSPPSIYPNLGQLQEQSQREEERERMQQEIDELKSRLWDLEVEKKKSVKFKGEVNVPAKREDPETKRRAKVSGKQRELGQSPGRESARETPSGASKF